MLTVVFYNGNTMTQLFLLQQMPHIHMIHVYMYGLTSSSGDNINSTLVRKGGAVGALRPLSLAV